MSSTRKYKLAQYGITPEEYDQRLSEQKGVCAICFEPCSSGRALAVDHDHASGEVHGLLCTKCNLGLGFLNDDPARMRSAQKYLVRGPRPQQFDDMTDEALVLGRKEAEDHVWAWLDA